MLRQYGLLVASLQIIFVCRKVICQARASFDWTRAQSGWTKNSKQYEEIKFQRE